MASSRRLRALITNDDGIDSARAARARRDGPRRRVRRGGGRAARGRERGQRVGEGRARRRRRRAAAPAGDPRAAGRRGVRGGGAPGVHRARVGPGLAGPAAGHRAVGGELRRQRRPVGAALRARSAPRSRRACTAGGASPSRSTPGWEIPERPHWDAVAHVLPQVLDLLLAADEGTVLSVNVPDRPAAELGALREAKLSAFGMATITVRPPRRGRRRRAARHRRGPRQPSRTPSPTSRCSPRATPRVTRLTSVADQPGVLHVARV